MKNKNRRLIIYDAPHEGPISGNEGDILFSANPIVNACAGCFGCWLKTPAKCVINDRCADIPRKIGQCGEIILITPCVYGGYSPQVKAVIDRSIGQVLPYFRIVDGEMHHKLRYKRDLKFTAYFYGYVSDYDRETAAMTVRANALNFGAEDYSAHFCADIDEARREALC